jgi:N-acetylglutamate synthase-like GNAT family acetyltransferase
MGEIIMANQEFELVAKLGIREAEAKDAEHLHTYCFPESTLEDITAELKDDLKSNRKKDVFRIVAEASGHAIGSVRVERNNSLPEVGEIGQLSVSAPFRAFGVAERLIETVEQLAGENDINMLQIEIPSTETSIVEAYKRFGFDERPVVTLQKPIDSSDQSAEEDSDESPSEEQSEEAEPEGGQRELL